MIAPFLQGLATAMPMLFQGISGINQKRNANQIKLQDTRPPEFREAIDMARQQANSQALPGQAQAFEKLDQAFANATNTAVQSGSSAAQVLAGLNKWLASNGAGKAQIATQAAQFQNQARNNLSGALMQDAAWKQNDLNAYNREKAALTQSANENIFGALSGLGTVGAYAAAGGFGTGEGKKKDNEGFLKPVVSSGLPTNAAQNSTSYLQNIGDRINSLPGAAPAFPVGVNPINKGGLYGGYSSFGEQINRGLGLGWPYNPIR